MRWCCWSTVGRDQDHRLEMPFLVQSGEQQGLIFSFFLVAPPPPRTISKEWEEASNERALEANLDPITGENPHPPYRCPTAALTLASGISSEGYSGKGFVTHK